MTKRKEKKIEEERDTSPSIPPLITGEGKKKENEFFTLGKWNGMTQWKCKFCPWDTLEGEGELMKHYIERHAPPAPPEPPKTILQADRWGNPINS